MKMLLGEKDVYKRQSLYIMSSRDTAVLLEEISASTQQSNICLSFCFDIFLAISQFFFAGYSFIFNILAICFSEHRPSSKILVFTIAATAFSIVYRIIIG